MFMIASNTETEISGPGDEPALICSEDAFRQAFHYWRGASGSRYLHSVYSLVGCPAMPQVNYILVRRESDGSRTPLAIGETTDEAVSLNLAALRHKGAKLGANEVHIHLLAETAEARRAVKDDLIASRGETASIAQAA
ncbi:hypothetical protein V6C03_02690 [Methyloligella sp. 2.7D]|uniref:hypothetical protein n=1 Tax=unclassified Methyloligella TaxID=2625955 RepID=UPI00157C47ED|nr:hypothetical protein [Methyloligella sp. GL2]QKP76467.1 hypothetical protein HT051_02730 [Methyloligella sp. GL2]